MTSLVWLQAISTTDGVMYFPPIAHALSTSHRPCFAWLEMALRLIALGGRVLEEEKECIKIRHWLDATSYCSHYGMPKNVKVRLLGPF